MRKFTVFLAAILLMSFNLAAQNTLIPFGSTWKYLDNGSDQGTAWRATAFDDGSWESGPAVLGYGNPPYNKRKEATVLSRGAYTTYFRKSITLASVPESFQFSIRRDDGVVVYVNGVEVFRNSMPGGNISYNTPALFSHDNGTAHQVFKIPGSAFVAGVNVVAVEIHQLRSPDSDMTFDLELTGKPGPGPQDPPHQDPPQQDPPLPQPGYAELIPFKSTWKYLDNGSNQGTAWRATAFDDGSWKSGPAILGYGNPPYNDRKEATIVNRGPYTTYFRKSINLASVPESFQFSIRRDDGVVVYVNGVEVIRNSMPGGIISYNTPALFSQDNGMKELLFDVPGSAFSPGVNVIAVEIHQLKSPDSDMTFDLKLTGKGGSTTPPEDQTAPTVLSLNRHDPSTQNTSNTSVTFQAIFSEAVTGVDASDFELAGAASGSIASVTQVSGTTYQVLVSSITGTGALGLNLKGSGTGIADQAGNPISGGFTGQAYNILPPPDQIAPTVLSLNRHDPATENTSNTSVTFQATFSEAVTGVDETDFELAGAPSGSIAAVTQVSATTYQVLVNSITGSGELGLNLKGSGTGIADQAGNPISGGFTGQIYLILAINNTPGFVSVTPLNSLPSRADATRDKQQAKVFFHADKHWAVLAKTGGTYLWRLDGTTWTEILQLSNRNNRSDAVLDGNLVHILMFGSASAPSQLRTLEYVPATNTFQYWSANPNMVEIPADPGMETVSLAKDGTGRLWIANEGGNEIHVSSSVSPYTTWTAPFAIATNIDEDDIAAAVYIPSQQRIGVLWSNQNTERFGFSTHLDGTPLDAWTADEVPGGQVAVDADGGGMADDHLNIKVGSDGTLYCAVKTSYDLEPEIGLLVRRPNGTWDQAFYPVAIEGTLPIVVLNESINRVRVVYTSATYGGDILYQESSTSNISFGAPIVLITGAFNNATSTHQNFTSDIVILASDADEVVGVLASDVPANNTLIGLRTAQTELSLEAGLQQDLKAFPNPFSTSATLSFALPAAGDYSLTVYDSKRMEAVFQSQGQARAGELTQVEIAGANLARGLYFVRLHTREGTSTLRLILDK